MILGARWRQGKLITPNSREETMIKIYALAFCFLLTGMLFSQGWVQVNVSNDPKKETVGLSPEFKRAILQAIGSHKD
jgi:hypothetical protein